MRGKIVGPRQLAALKTPSGDSGYGLGTGVDARGCAGMVYGHNGGGDGFESNVYVSGDGRRVAVLLLNGRAPASGGDDRASSAMRAMYCAAETGRRYLMRSCRLKCRRLGARTRSSAPCSSRIAPVK